MINILTRSDKMDDFEIFIRLAFCGFSFLLFAVSLLSALRLKKSKLFFAAIGFGLFFAQGVLLGVGVFLDSAEEFVTIKNLSSLTFSSLIFLYISIIKR